MLSGQKKTQFQVGRLTQSQIRSKAAAQAKKAVELQRDLPREAAVRPLVGQSAQDSIGSMKELNQRMEVEMGQLSAQIALLTQAVTALTAAIQENTEAMGGEEEEVAQTGGFLGDATEEDAPAPHL